MEPGSQQYTQDYSQEMLDAVEGKMLSKLVEAAILPSDAAAQARCSSKGDFTLVDLCNALETRAEMSLSNKYYIAEGEHDAARDKVVTAFCRKVRSEATAEATTGNCCPPVFRLYIPY